MLKHIKEFYDIKCKSISCIKAAKDILIKTNTNSLSYKDIIYKIDSACILFKIESDNFKIDNNISLERRTALAVKTSLDNKSLRDVPSIPANCIALAYILQKQNLEKKKSGIFNSTSSPYILGGKMIGKLVLTTLGPVSLIISGLGILNKAIKTDAKTMKSLMEIDNITSKLIYQINILEKIDLKICCLKNELYNSMELLENFNSSNTELNSELLDGISSICDILEEKI